MSHETRESAVPRLHRRLKRAIPFSRLRRRICTSALHTDCSVGNSPSRKELFT